MTSVRKKDWEALNYVISEKADEIDQLIVVGTDAWPDYVVCSDGTWTTDYYQK